MAHLTEEHVQELYETYGELKVLDDIIRYRAADDPSAPILGYPRSEDTVTEYEYFTGKELDHFIDGAVKYFLKSGLKPVRASIVLSKASPDHGLTPIIRIQERSLAFLAPLMSTLLSPFLPLAVWATLFLPFPSGYRLSRLPAFSSKPIAISLLAVMPRPSWMLLQP